MPRDADFNGSAYAKFPKAVSGSFTIALELQGEYNFGWGNMPWEYGSNGIVDARGDWGIASGHNYMTEGARGSGDGLNRNGVAGSAAAISDGSWHYATFTRDSTDGLLNLTIDGTYIDSAYGNTGDLTTEPYMQIGKALGTSGTCGLSRVRCANENKSVLDP
eukprot:3074904-Prymnesium_polylepis.1